MWKIHVRENIGTFNSHAGKILGQEIPITREKKRDIPVSCKGLVSFSQSGKFTKKTTKTLKQPTLFTSWELQNITCDIAMNSSIWTINGWSLSKFWFSHFCCKFLILFDSCEHSVLVTLRCYKSDLVRCCFAIDSLDKRAYFKGYWVYLMTCVFRRYREDNR